MFCLSACCLVGREIFSNTIPNNSNTHIIILSAWWVGVDGTRVHKFPEVLNARGLSHLEHLEHLESTTHWAVRVLSSSSVPAHLPINWLEGA